jgi:signal transduction histidine kinase
VLGNLRDAYRFGELDAAAMEKAVADGNRLVQKMSSTINDFRDFVQPTGEKRAFSVLGQVRATLSLVAGTFEHAGVAVEIVEGEDATLVGYANEYAHVLMNLFANARQAIEGAGTAHGKVTVRHERRDGQSRLTVRDTGGGIPEAIRDRIFDPYFTTKPAGTGIGLYLSRQIAQRTFGGRLDARNVEEGAEFCLLAPLPPETPAP